MLAYSNKQKRRDHFGKVFYTVEATCPCGKIFVVRLSNLRRGQKSCGCKKGNFKHGMKGTRPYRIWRNMKDRCTNPKNKDWHRYGGRGISYCPRWSEFKKFWDDMHNGYSKDLTIDRIDNDGNYCKDNCRWSTLLEQAANTGRNVALFNGETARQAGIRINKNPSLVYQRLNAGWTVEEAFTKASRRPKIN